MLAQRFSLPNLPFHKEINGGCAVGTVITVKARPLDDSKKSLTISLSASSSVALLLTVHLGPQGHISLTSITNGVRASPVDRQLATRMGEKLTIEITVKEHVYEVYVNSSFQLDYVHRTNSLDVRLLSVEGAVIVDEVILKPPDGLAPPPYKIDRGSPVQELPYPRQGKIEDEMSRLTLEASSGSRGQAPPPYTPSANIPINAATSIPTAPPNSFSPSFAGAAVERGPPVPPRTVYPPSLQQQAPPPLPPTSSSAYPNTAPPPPSPGFNTMNPVGSGVYPAPYVAGGQYPPPAVGAGVYPAAAVYPQAAPPVVYPQYYPAGYYPYGTAYYGHHHHGHHYYEHGCYPHYEYDHHHHHHC